VKNDDVIENPTAITKEEKEVVIETPK